MALKMNVTTAVYDALPDAVKAEYKRSGDGYVLDLDGYEDPAELRRARDRERDSARDFKAQLDTANQTIKDLQGDDARRTGDIDRIEKRMQKKYDEDTGALNKTITDMRNGLVTSALDTTARELAGKLSPKNAAVLLPHVRGRLDAEYDTTADKVVVHIKDKDGKRSADLTSDKLLQEFRDNAEFGGIVAASQASGGGARSSNTPNGSGGAGPRVNQSGQGDGQSRPVHQSSPADIRARILAQKEAEGQA